MGQINKERSSYSDIILCVWVHALLPVKEQIVFAREARMFGVEFQHPDEGWAHHRDTTATVTGLSFGKRLKDGDEKGDGSESGDGGEDGYRPGTPLA